MVFDHTKGERAMYMVSVYRWNVQDRHFYSNYREAKAFFNALKEEDHEKGTVISLYNVPKDIRKEFVKF